MKCPMAPSDGVLNSECVQEECAWWHKYTRQCAIAVLANTFTLFQKFGYGRKKDDADKGGF